jgi:hypothetical protein
VDVAPGLDGAGVDGANEALDAVVCVAHCDGLSVVLSHGAVGGGNRSQVEKVEMRSFNAGEREWG